MSLAQMTGFEDKSACHQCCPDLSYKARLFGFIGCTGAGFVISSIGTFVLFSGFSEANITTFVILYIIGNLMSIGGTLFLSGPASQCKKMWDKSRRWSTTFYLAMLIIVFAVAITKQHIAIILSMLFIEILAAIWYSASFVPFGRSMITGCLRGGPCGPCFTAYDKVAERCTQCKEKIQKATGTEKKQESSWFGGGSDSKSNSGGIFGGGSSDKNSGGSWFGGEKEPEKSSWFGGSNTK